MPNGVTLIAGHNIIMTPELAERKFAKGEITNRQIVTTQEDYDAARDGKVGQLEEQGGMSGWSQLDAQQEPTQPNASVVEAEEQAREEAKEYIGEGGVDWGRVENDTSDIMYQPEGEVEQAIKAATIAHPPDSSDKFKNNELFKEFEEFLKWKQQKGE